MIQHGSDGTILIQPSAAARQAGVLFLVLANLPAILPVALLLIYPSGRTWRDIAILGGVAVAWLAVVTFWQAGNQPWFIHADANTVWTTRRIAGRQKIQRVSLAAIQAISATYLYNKGVSSVEPTYSFLNHEGRVMATVKAKDYSLAEMEELARYLKVPLKADSNQTPEHSRN